MKERDTAIEADKEQVVSLPACVCEREGGERGNKKGESEAEIFEYGKAV